MDMKNYRDCQIISNDALLDNVYKMTLSGKFEGKPGQFFMVRNWENDPLLSRPLGICDLGEDYLTFLYLVYGRGTKNFSNLKPGDNIKVFGPLGNGFDLGNHNKVAIISGAAGIAPMYYLAKNLKCKVDLYAGFRDYSFFTGDFKELVENVYISSDLGKEGFHGNVIDLFLSRNETYDMIYSCGPKPMLKALSQRLSDKNIQISMESHMACGFGVCLGCAITTREGIKKVCQDGPVFDAKEVIFDA